MALGYNRPDDIPITISTVMQDIMLLLSLVFYLKYEAPPDEQNFPMVMELLRAGEVREDDDSYVSPLDELFDRLEMENPEHIALKYYRDYHSGSAKTLRLPLLLCDGDGGGNGTRYFHDSLCRKRPVDGGE